MQNNRIGQHTALVRCIEIAQEYNDLVDKHSLRIVPLTSRNYKSKMVDRSQVRCAVRRRLSKLVAEYHTMYKVQNGY
ncbi:hypothetical protein EVB91_095 [Rhizobium phage RHph_I1_18]|nr:hypothetical protein EVB91_095 [Rhizobium phage RHph_I1_18]